MTSVPQEVTSTPEVTSTIPLSEERRREVERVFLAAVRPTRAPLDIEAFVKDHYRRNRDVMERLQRL